MVVVAGDHAERLAMFHFAAFTAGGKPFALGAFADGAERLAKRRFGAFDAAAGAVDHLWRDFHFVEFRPFFGDFCSQHVVIVDGGDAGFALFAVESAASDILIHFILRTVCRPAGGCNPKRLRNVQSSF